MIKIDPIEFKIILISVISSMVAPVDYVIKFFIPIASGFAWMLIKPQLEIWQKQGKFKFKKKQKK